MKKIISLFLVIQVLFTMSFSVNANEAASEELFEKYTALGFIWDNDGKPDLTLDITRGEFATLLSKIQGVGNNADKNLTSDMETPKQKDFFDMESETENNEIYMAVQNCVKIGIMKTYDDGSFSPDKPIKLDDVYYSFVKLLGYDKNAQYLGGYPSGYRTVAEQIGLSKGVNSGYDNYVSGNSLLKIIENLSDINIMLPKISNGSIILEEQEGKTILTQGLNIFSKKGRIDANEYSSILAEEPAAPGEVKIDGIPMKAADTGAECLLGYEAEVYYRDDDGEYTILWLDVDRENELFVYAKDIESFSDRTFKYNQGNTIKTAYLSQKVKVIYNGVAVTSYRDSDFLMRTGDVTLLKTDSDKYYDIAIIEDYENYVIDSVNFEKCVLYDVKDKTTPLTWDEDADVRIFSENFNKRTVADLTQNSVVSVSKSKDGKLVTMLICSKTVDGTINGIGTEDDKPYITINNKDYYLDKYYDNADNRSDFGLGVQGKFYLDIDGNIVYMSLVSYGKWITAYAIKAYVNDEGNASIKLFDGEIKDIAFAESVKIDGIKRQNIVNDAGRIDTSEIKTDQLMRYKLNNDGKITTIDYASKGKPDLTHEDINTLRKMSDEISNVWYRTGLNAMSDNFFMSADTKVFIIPYDHADYNSYRIEDTSIFKNSVYNGLTPYCVGDKSDSAEIVVMDLKNDGKYIHVSNDKHYIYVGSEQGVNDEDEIITYMKYYDMSGVLHKTPVTNNTEPSDVSGMSQNPSDWGDLDALNLLDSGDLIKLYIRDEEIVKIYFAFDCSERASGSSAAVIDQGGSASTSTFEKLEYTHAYRRTSKVLFITSSTAEVKDIYSLPVISASCPIYKFDTKKKKLEAGVITDIIDAEGNPTGYTSFVLNCYNNAPQMILIYE